MTEQQVRELMLPAMQRAKQLGETAAMEAALKLFVPILERLAPKPVPLPPASHFSDGYGAPDADEGAEASEFSAADVPQLRNYYAADDKGHYPGNLHRYFKCSVKQFATGSGLVQRRFSEQHGDRTHQSWRWVESAPASGRKPATFAEVTSDRGALQSALRDDPHNMVLRGALADYIDDEENGGQESAQTRHIRAPGPLQMSAGGHIHYPGERAVTVARHGAAMTGGPVSRPIYETALYHLLPRADGTLTWRRAGGLGDTTSGSGITGPMVARARAHAEANGLPYLPGIRHGHLAGTVLTAPEPEPAPEADPNLPVRQPSAVGNPGVAPRAFAEPPSPQPAPEPVPARRPKQRSGAFTPEQHQLLTAAFEGGDRTAWGALGDHLAENGHPGAGGVLSSYATGRGDPVLIHGPGEDFGDMPAPGRFRYYYAPFAKFANHVLVGRHTDGTPFYAAHTEPYETSGQSFAEPSSGLVQRRFSEQHGDRTHQSWRWVEPGKKAKAFADATNHEALSSGLQALSRPEHVQTRAGGAENPHADIAFRGQLADLLQDHGREEEANHLRDPGQHVMVHNNEVVPAQYTTGYIEGRDDAITRHLRVADSDYEPNHGGGLIGHLTGHAPGAVFLYRGPAIGTPLGDLIRDNPDMVSHVSQLPDRIAHHIEERVRAEPEFAGAGPRWRREYERRVAALRAAPFEVPLPVPPLRANPLGVPDAVSEDTGTPRTGYEHLSEETQTAPKSAVAAAPAPAAHSAAHHMDALDTALDAGNYAGLSAIARDLARAKPDPSHVRRFAQYHLPRLLRSWSSIEGAPSDQLASLGIRDRAGALAGIDAALGHLRGPFQLPADIFPEEVKPQAPLPWKEGVRRPKPHLFAEPVPDPTLDTLDALPPAAAGAVAQALAANLPDRRYLDALLAELAAVPADRGGNETDVY